VNIPTTDACIKSCDAPGRRDKQIGRNFTDSDVCESNSVKLLVLVTLHTLFICLKRLKQQLFRKASNENQKQGVSE